jgi:hypothetical protein
MHEIEILRIHKLKETFSDEWKEKIQKQLGDPMNCAERLSHAI